MSEFWKRVEAKVKWSALAALGASLLLAVLNATVGDSQVLGGLPGWLQFLLVTCGPTAATFLAGYKARHEARPPVRVAKEATAVPAAPSRPSAPQYQRPAADVLRAVDEQDRAAARAAAPRKRSTGTP